MLTPRFIRENLDAVEANLKKRHANFGLGDFRKWEEERLTLIREGELLKSERNQISKDIGAQKQRGEDIGPISARMKEFSDRIKGMDERLAHIEASVADFCHRLPNMLDPSVPEGKTDAENVEIRKHGVPVKHDFPVVDHHTLGEKLGIIDFERATKVAGTRFAVMQGLGAKLERALIQFFLNENGARGYTEVSPPIIVNRDSLVGTGQLPKFEEDLFHLHGYEGRYYLIPTAEVPLTNLYRDEIIPEVKLPIRLAAYTPCFRSEAGSAGKDTRGIIRQHQFHKVEIVSFVKPEDSAAELEKLTSDAENLLQKLEIPYRVVLHCAGDLGFGGAKGYDIEVWIPAQNRYMEISSCTNFADFQANRSRIRYKDAAGKNSPVHTLNGSALAVGRTIVAILENFQQKDGSVLIPKVLQPLLGTDLIRAEKGV
ncbi:MAG: serine--tRNA ligase [Spirochaetia bacterium]|nr:serine--tRNA ligase [Spirochaetia bacterium]